MTSNSTTVAQMMIEDILARVRVRVNILLFSRGGALGPLASLASL